MREILFRGKRVDNGEWVYGNYAWIDDSCKQYFIFQNKPLEHEVIPSTIGQYTGLTDDNGVKIFEWDIVEYKGERYVIKYLEKHARFVPTKPNTVFAVFSYANAEVIGNVHDNPELLNKESE